MVKAEVAKAVDAMKVVVSEALAAMTEKALRSVGPWKALPWRLPLERCKDLLHMVPDATPMLCKYILEKGSTDIVGLAHDVGRHTPQYAHILGDGRMNAALARKHLLEWPSRTALTQMTVKLQGCIRDHARLHGRWNLSPSITSDPDFGDNMVAANTLSDTAKRAIITIAALSALLESTQGEKQQKCRAILDRKRDDLPPTLVAQLERAVADKNTDTS